jgi:hypothetical protein
MHDEWSDISKGRISKKIKGEIVIIKPCDDYQRVPLVCPLCEFLFRGMEDITMFKRYGVCSECSLRWAQSREKEWGLGWRPTSTELYDYIEGRLRIPSYRIR